MGTLMSNPLIIWGYLVLFFSLVGFSVITFISFQKENITLEESDNQKGEQA